jgi:hypothetical protein
LRFVDAVAAACGRAWLREAQCSKRELVSSYAHAPTRTHKHTNTNTQTHTLSGVLLLCLSLPLSLSPSLTPPPQTPLVPSQCTLQLVCTTITAPWRSASPRRAFSKVLSTVTFYCKSARALTFENICQGRQQEPPRPGVAAGNYSQKYLLQGLYIINVPGHTL